MDDPVLLDDWHPVAASAQLQPGMLLAVRLLDRDLVVWRSADGSARAWADRCPHRGTRLSLGQVKDDRLVCPYHGWRFAPDGRCTQVPALPDFSPPAQACAHAYGVEERYGMVWVCVGKPRRAVLPFPEYGDSGLRKVLCGPYEVATSGPRIVENFLDMAHFAFVHTGILGDESSTAVGDYAVGPYDDGEGGTGVIATECFAWQPLSNSLAQGGSNVEYTYRVVRPLSAILTKFPARQPEFREAISLHVQPSGAEASVVWIVLAMTNFEQSDDELRAFQDRIFLQDKPIVESQQPRCLPLAPGAELPVSCDRMSMAYRRYLRDAGLRYGVLSPTAEEA